MSKISLKSKPSTTGPGQRRRRSSLKILKPFGFCCSYDNIDPLTRYDKLSSIRQASLESLTKESPTLKFRTECIDHVDFEQLKIAAKAKELAIGDYERKALRRGRLNAQERRKLKFKKLLKQRRKLNLQRSGKAEKDEDDEEDDGDFEDLQEKWMSALQEGPIKWHLEDEIQAGKDVFWEERQRTHDDTEKKNTEIGKTRVLASNDKHSDLYPRWYQDFSLDQMMNLRLLQCVMQRDREERVTGRTQRAVTAIGIVSTFFKLSPEVLKKLLETTRKVTDFLREIYKMMTGNYFEDEGYKSFYDCNERIVLTAIAFTSLPEAIVELHERLPPVEEVEIPPKPTPPTIPTRERMDSPYKEELFVRPDWVSYVHLLQKWRIHRRSLAIPRSILPPKDCIVSSFEEPGDEHYEREGKRIESFVEGKRTSDSPRIPKKRPRNYDTRAKEDENPPGDRPVSRVPIKKRDVEDMGRSRSKQKFKRSSRTDRSLPPNDGSYLDATKMNSTGDGLQRRSSKRLSVVLEEKARNDEEKTKIVKRKFSGLNVPPLYENTLFDFVLNGISEKPGPVEYKICGVLQPPQPNKKSWLDEKHAHYVISGASEEPPTCPVTYEMTGVANVTPSNSNEKFFGVLNLGDGPNKIYPEGRKHLSRQWQEWLQNVDEEYRKVEREANRMIKAIEAITKLVFPEPTCDSCCSCRQTRKSYLKAKETKLPYFVVDTVVEDENKKKYIVGSMAMHSPAPTPPESTVNLLDYIASEDVIKDNVVISGVTTETGETQYFITGSQKEMIRMPRRVIERSPPRPPRNVPPCVCAIQQMFTKGLTPELSHDNIPWTKDDGLCFGHKFRPQESPAYSCKMYPGDKSCRRSPFMNALVMMQKKKERAEREAALKLDYGKEKNMFGIAEFPPCGDEHGMGVCGAPWGTLHVLTPAELAELEKERKEILRGPPCGTKPGRAVCEGPFGERVPERPVEITIKEEIPGEMDEELEEEEEEEEEEEDLVVQPPPPPKKEKKRLRGDKCYMSPEAIESRRQKIVEKTVKKFVPDPTYPGYDDPWNIYRTAPTEKESETDFKTLLKLSSPRPPATPVPSGTTVAGEEKTVGPSKRVSGDVRKHGSKQAKKSSSDHGRKRSLKEAKKSKSRYSTSKRRSEEKTTKSRSKRSVHSITSKRSMSGQKSSKMIPSTYDEKVDRKHAARSKGERDQNVDRKRAKRTSREATVSKPGAKSREPTPSKSGSRSREVSTGRSGKASRDGTANKPKVISNPNPGESPKREPPKSGPKTEKQTLVSQPSIGKSRDVSSRRLDAGSEPSGSRREMSGSPGRRPNPGKESSSPHRGTRSADRRSEPNTRVTSRERDNPEKKGREEKNPRSKTKTVESGKTDSKRKRARKSSGSLGKKGGRHHHRRRDTDDDSDPETSLKTKIQELKTMLTSSDLHPRDVKPAEIPEVGTTKCCTEYEDTESEEETKVEEEAGEELPPKGPCGWKTKSEQELPAKKTLVYLTEPDYPPETVDTRTGGRPCRCREIRATKKILKYAIGGLIGGKKDEVAGDKKKLLRKKKKEEEKTQVIEGALYYTPPPSPRNSDEYVPEYDLYENPYDMCQTRRKHQHIRLLERYATPQISEGRPENKETCGCNEYVDTYGIRTTDEEEEKAAQARELEATRETLMSAKPPKERWTLALKDVGLLDYFTRCRDNMPCWLKCAKFDEVGCPIPQRKLKTKRPVCECKYERKILEHREEKVKYKERQKRLKSLKKQPFVNVQDISKPLVPNTKLMISNVKRIPRDDEYVDDVKYCISGVAENYTHLPPKQVVAGVHMATPIRTPEASQEDIPCVCLHRHWSPMKELPVGPLPRPEELELAERKRRQQAVIDAYRKIYAPEPVYHTHEDHGCTEPCGEEQETEDGEHEEEDEAQTFHPQKHISRSKLTDHWQKRTSARDDGKTLHTKTVSRSKMTDHPRKETPSRSKITDGRHRGSPSKTDVKTKSDKARIGDSPKMAKEMSRGKMHKTLERKKRSGHEEGDGEKEEVEEEENGEESVEEDDVHDEFVGGYLMAIVKVELKKMAAEGYLFAQLPKCFLLPQLRYWLMYRKGFVLSETDKLNSVRDSLKMWDMLDALQGKTLSIEPPPIKMTKLQLRKLTFDSAYKMKRKIAMKKEIFLSQVRKNRVMYSRTMWNTMEYGKFPSKSFKQAYFTYMASKESDGHVFKPWQCSEVNEMF